MPLRESVLVNHCLIENFLLITRLNERTFEATAVGLSEGESFVLCA